ncbi:MAG: agmatine deiminase family protein, partial [Leptospiraceae bacterium]|nr:agmatine deiminase family protein [Leptospiraceae bacterium]
MTQFRMPPEWAPHAATWASWPRNVETWPHNLAEARREFASLVAAISEDEPVYVLAGAGDDAETANRTLGSLANVHTIEFATNDAWMRDYGPTFVVDDAAGQVAGVDWRYNAWGGKYPPFDDDVLNAARILQRLGLERREADLCLEGGAIEIDGDGIAMCTKTCAFDPHRNPNLTPAEIERRICEAIGATAMLWLTGDALLGDDTDGHIDQLARFTPT